MYLINKYVIIKLQGSGRMNKFIENYIISENRHQFIYGSDGEKRKTFLHELAKNNPVVMNENEPMAIYLDKVGLPNYYLYQFELDRIKLATFSSEYLNFSIAYEMTNSLLNNCNYDDFEYNVSYFLKKINKLSDCNTNISTLEDLNNLLKRTRNFYYENYCMYSKIGEHSNFIEEIPISFLDINYFTKLFKEMINNNSYFCIIVDYQKDMSLTSM